MIIMCAKCKKPAVISQMVDRENELLCITASCHGRAQTESYSRRFLEENPEAARQIENGIGVAFRQAAPLDA